MPGRVRALRQASKVNCAPRSEVTVTGMPKREIQLSMNIWTNISAVAFVMGTASGQRVVLSRERAHDVDVNMAEACWRDRNREDGRVGVPGDFVHSAGVTLSCPAKYVAAHSLPSV